MASPKRRSRRFSSKSRSTAAYPLAWTAFASPRKSSRSWASENPALMKVVYAFALFAAFAFVLYGWGWAVRRLLSVDSRAESRSWPGIAATGMAAVVFLGGVLNLARLA